MKKNLSVSQRINSIPAEWKTAFVSVFVIGLIAHIYKFTNTLLTHDSLWSQYTYNNMIGSGRWFLAVASAPSSTYDLPWLIGLLSLVWIGLTAVVLVDYFKLKNRFAVIVCSGLLVTFPPVVNTFTFEFTADAYFMAMLLAAIGAHLSMVGKNKIWQIALATLCICLSLGIYQAYISFALLMALCHFMLELLKGGMTTKECLRWILNQIIIYASALIAYMLIWKLCMAVQNAAPTEYLSIDKINFKHLNLAGIISSLRRIVRIILDFFHSRDIFYFGWSIYAVLNTVFLLFLAAELLVAVIKTGLWKRVFQLVLFGLCGLAIPVFACIWVFTSPDVLYHLLMLQSLYVIYIFAVAVANEFLGICFKKIVCVLMAVLTVKFTVQANQVYFEMNFSMERSRATGIEMLTRIHQLDDGSLEKIALVGSRQQSLTYLGYEKYEEIWVHGGQIRYDLVFDNYYGNLFLKEYLGSTYTPVSEEELAQLKDSEEVKEMPKWPLAGSVAVVDGVVVVKLSS